MASRGMVWPLYGFVNHELGTASTRRELRGGLAVISLLFVTHVALITLWTDSSAMRAQQLYQDSLISQEIVTRIARDLDQQHILLGVHISESAAEAWSRIERQLDRLTVDLRQAERAYSDLVELPGEEAAWRETQRLIGGFERMRADVLALSRRNRDGQARARMTGNFVDHAKLQTHLGELMVIDRAGAVDAMRHIQRLHRINVGGILATGSVVLLVVLTLGRRAVRRVMSYEEQVVRYARTLEARNRELDAFAGRLAHDLLGPVATLTLSVDLLSRLRGDEHRSALDRLRRSTEQIATMTNDLLAFARAESAVTSASCDPVAVAATVGQDFLARFGDQARWHAALEGGRLACREGLLRQVLWNLVENGVKYRRENVEAVISVAGYIVDGWYELHVSDNGIGILPEDVPHIFEPLYRADPTRHIPGTGLGLSIVKRVVEADGGAIALQTQPGWGTTFVLRLPLVASAPGLRKTA